MAPWLRFLEAYMVQALLRTPAFHRGVEKVARTVHRIQHGTPPEEMGGTKIDGPTDGSFLRHFTEEVQTQLGRAEARSHDSAVARSVKATGEAEGAKVEDEGADAVWRNAQKSASEAPKQGFMDEYIGALREQVKNRR